MFVNIGLQNELLKTVLDPINGQLTDTRTRYVVLLFFVFCPIAKILNFCSDIRFLGTRAVKLIRVHIQRNPAILALSSQSWLNYTYQNLMHFTPLIYDNLDDAWSFSAELSPEGLIGIAESIQRYVVFTNHF